MTTPVVAVLAEGEEQTHKVEYTTDGRVAVTIAGLEKTIILNKEQALGWIAMLSAFVKQAP